MTPPYTLTPDILDRSSAVMRLLGRIEAMESVARQSLELRRQNRVKSIYSTLSIEGNTLSLEQVSAVIDKQPVLGPQKEILEVTNAVSAYDRLAAWDCCSLDHLLAAHGLMMQGLTPETGRFRSRGVGIQKGAQVTHIAPPAERVPGLMYELFDHLRNSQDHMLIRSSVVHYEIEFIHPFSDGNGRMGRLWQTAMLMQLSPLFEYVPVESVIKSRQADYYQVLEACDNVGESSDFVAFMLTALIDALEPLVRTPQKRRSAAERLELAIAHFGNDLFSRKDYRALHPTLSTASASRDLRRGCESGLLEAIGDGRMTRYRCR